MAEVTRASIDSAGPPGSVGKAGAVTQATEVTAAGPVTPDSSVTPESLVTPDSPVTSLESAEPVVRPGTRRPVEGHGPVERFMSTVIRKLSWSRLANPRVAMTVSGCGLLLSAIVGATAPNTVTLPTRLPLSNFLPSLRGDNALTFVLLYGADILACLGLAGMLWAHSQGWRPNPKKLLLASAGVVAVLVSLTPVGSSDTASYAAFGRIAALGKNPYLDSPLHALKHSQYLPLVGNIWRNQVSVYGPIATWVQRFAATIGGPHAWATLWVLMILNGLVFLGIGWLLLKTSDDPIRATLFWVANPVLIQQLVSGGHLDTFVAAVCICAIQAARKVSGLWGDVLIGVLIGLACGVKVNAVLVAVGLAWPMLRRHEWMRTARITFVALATVALLYSGYGITALKPLIGGSKWVILPSPWRIIQACADWLGFHSGLFATYAQSGKAVSIAISLIWPIAMVVVAWFIYQRISSDQPQEVVAPFALSFAWVLVAPWVFPWWTALAWVALTQVPRNRMTRWLTIVTVLLAIWHSGGGQGQIPGHGQL
ncbi:MAG TPA: hypothetical protein VGI66_03780 [Streptosporangiaceae bacterium]|jgi:hypothetical protein